MILFKEKCHICGKNTEFQISDSMTLFRDAKCSFCGTTVRTSDLAGTILKEYGRENSSLEEVGESLPLKTIINASTSGFVHEYFKLYPGYFCGEYLDNVKSGEYKKGTLCIDLCMIPFGDNSVDIVISEDVFEHVQDYRKAFAEVNRVLKTGGKHVFTVPLHENNDTISRVGNEKEVYHGDPIRPESGSLVYTDFGRDIISILGEFGFESEVVTCHRFYDKSEITNVDETYDEYLAKSNHLEEYFKYNSVVIIATKKNAYIREQLRPDCLCGMHMDLLFDAKEFDFEYLHRYYSICELVKEKSVLDIDCGEGYGSYIISKTAKRVLGVSNNKNIADCANKKYKEQKNLSYTYSESGRLSRIEDNSVDVVVIFETIEYLQRNIQEGLLEEIKRVLTQKGILIISTPDRMEYVDKFEYRNENHQDLFYRDEFLDFISRKFKKIVLYKQFLEVASFLQPFEGLEHNMRYYENEELYKPTQKYLVAVATNDDTYEMNLTSVCMSEKNEYYLLNCQIRNQKAKVIQKENIIRLQSEELERRHCELEHRMELINDLRKQVQEKENIIKLQDEELERRALELENRMNVINEVSRRKEEAENIIKLQNEELDRRLQELDNRMIKINELTAEIKK